MVLHVKRGRCLRWWLLVGAALGLTTPLWISAALGHQGALAFWNIAVDPRSASSKLSISLLDLHFIQELDENQDAILEYAEVERRQDEIERRVAENFKIRNGGRDATFEVTGFKIQESGELELEIEHAFDGPVTQLELESTFYEITDLSHRVFCKLQYREEIHQYYFDLYNQRHTIEIEWSWGTTFRQIGRFVVLGIEHIFTGYDHLAFLLGLMLLGGSIRNLVAIVTSFTVAHSITLSLATLDVVVLPTRFVESAIALSIFYIAMENIFLQEVRDRWKISFFFGLIHGFGFSNILREMQLPSKGLLVSLLSFNSGVELGQIAVIVVVFPLILLMHRQQWRQHMVRATSAVIGALGVFWFVERLI